MRPGLAAVVLCSMLNACSEECVLEACEDALRPQPKGQLAQGIVGVAAYRTDACVNDCCECNYTDATLKIFGIDDGVRDAEDAQMRFAQQEPFTTLQIHERYAQALEPGRWAVCDQELRTCANLEVRPGEVLTLNVQAVFGPMLMRVFDADGKRLMNAVVGDGAPY